MSLLIKALDKAENDKAENDKSANDNVEHSNTKKLAEKSNANDWASENLALSSSPTNSKNNSTSAPSPVSSSSPASSASPKSAANVFSSKGVDVSDQNTSLALIAGAGLVALLAMGIYYYQFADNAPDVVIAPRLSEMAQPVQVAQTQPLPPFESSAALPAEATPVPAAMPQDVAPNDGAQPVAIQEMPIKQVVKKPVENKKSTFTENTEVLLAENETVVDETAVVNSNNKKRGKIKKLQFGESIASPSASINVSKTKSEAEGVNPVLMSAYEAYNVGDDANAQKLYKQVLQRDVRNVDALLGLGAIASRQGRDADANGWYGKVLEVEPRNSMAQAALLDSQPQGSGANSESRIKNMLAKTPNDANLHVALGHVYAEQNQWPAAQQAYFDAYSLSTSADNAFNLAVSLDQMGKPKLALPYYQRALEQASDTSAIDKAALEARIAVIQ